MATPTPQTPEISGQVLFYGKPEPLNPELHKALGVEQSDRPFGFAAKANAVPVTVTEFGLAGLSYPVIFSGPDATPLAVMSLTADANLFIDAGGRFLADAYVPAFIRRYPFVLANDDEQKRMIVCIDRAAPQLVAGGTLKLFDKGEATDFTKMAIDFCSKFEEERQRTESFVGLLKEMDLLELKEVQYTPADDKGAPGQPQKLADYTGVSETKLNALAPDKLAQLRDNGALQQIYAHLNSLSNWQRLINMTAALSGVNAPAAGNA